MKRAFKVGDTIYYGEIKGTLVGILGSQGLFFADTAQEGFLTHEQMLYTSPAKESDLTERFAYMRMSNSFFYIIKEYFGYATQQTTRIRKALQESRFKLLPLAELKHTNSKEEFNRLLNHRHKYLVMVKYHLKRNNYDEAAIHRLCDKIETLQSQIESFEE